jgi:hypothetical protein
MNKFFLPLAIAMFFFISCVNNKSDLNLKTTKLEISYCSVCGWCAGGDSLHLTVDSTYFLKNKPCEELTNKKDILTNKKDWNELLDLLDYEEFQKIDLNTCNVCADGCDSWITVTDGINSHTIRYGFADSSTIETIRPFVDKLAEIKAKVNTFK